MNLTLNIKIIQIHRLHDFIVAQGQFHTDVMSNSLAQGANTLLTNDGSLSLTVHESAETFLTLHSEWNGLVEAAHATANQTWEWMFYWWKYFGNSSNSRLHLLLIRDHDVLVGIVPLCADKKYFGNVFLSCTLKFVGSGKAYSRSYGRLLDDGPTDFLDAIVMPGYEVRVAKTFLEYLEKHGKQIDLIELVNLPEDGFMMTYFIPFFSSQQFHAVMTKADICPRLSTPRSMDEYLKDLSSSTRRRFSQALKAGREEHKFSVHDIQTKGQVHEILSQLKELHQRRWNSLGFPGLFMDRKFEQFLEQVALSFYDNGWLWCKWAEVNGKSIASRLGFQMNGVIADYLSGFDDAIPEAKHRPGLALLLMMIEDAIRRGDTFVDFLRGDEKYKFELTTESRFNWNVSIVNTGSKGFILTFLYRSVRFFELMGFILSKELQLLKVQYRVHGIFSCLYHYGVFRSRRVTHKIQSLTHRQEENTVS